MDEDIKDTLNAIIGDMLKLASNTFIELEQNLPMIEELVADHGDEFEDVWTHCEDAVNSAEDAVEEIRKAKRLLEIT